MAVYAVEIRTGTDARIPQTNHYVCMRLCADCFLGRGLKMKKYIRHFEKLGLKDVALVGGKNASLGELISELAHENIRDPAVSS